MVATGLRSVEAAMDFVYDADESTGKMAHTYVGYFPVTVKDPSRLLMKSLNPDDTEAALQFEGTPE